MRWLALVLLLPAAVQAQAPDSVRRIPVTRTVTVDSVAVYYTRLQAAKPDTIRLTDSLYCSAAACPPGAWSRSKPTGGGTVAGIPFGHFREPRYGPLRTAGYLVVPQGEIGRLAEAKAAGARVFVNVTGATSNAQCALDAAGQFQFTLWRACFDRYGTPAVLKALNAYGDSGTAILYLIDEPNLQKRWGTIKPSTVEQMAQYTKSKLPRIPIAVRASPGWLGRLPSVDLAWAQYAERRGPVDQYRDQQVADAKRFGYALVLGLNALNGGPENDDTPMSPQQVLTFGAALLQAKPCAFLLWQYDPAWSARPDIAAAIDSLARLAAGLTPTCGRP